MKTISFVFICFLFCQESSFAQSDTCFIRMENLTSKNLKSLCTEGDIQTVIITGPTTNVGYSDLLNKLSANKNIQTIEFYDANFFQVPDELKKFPDLKKVVIRNNNRLLDIEGLNALTELDQLRELEVDIPSLNKIPEDLSELPQLDKLILHEKLLPDELKPAECIYVKHDLYKNDLFVKDIQAMVYISQSTWNTMHAGEAEAKVRTKKCEGFDRKYVHVNPPSENLIIKKEVMSIPAEAGGMVKPENSMSVIKIPENAFVDENGNPVVGNVDIDYREYKNPIDFIASGIPMSFERGEDMEFFKSAGMFEMNASQNGKEVFLKEGERVEILFASTDNVEDYPFLAFDDKANNWVELTTSTPAEKTEVQRFTGLSAAVNSYMYGAWTFVPFIDTTAYSDRFSDLRYYNAGRERIMKSFGYYRWNAEKYPEGRKHNPIFNYIRIRSVRKGLDDQTYFKLENKALIWNEFKDIKTYYWRVEDGYSPNELRKQFAGKKRYNDMKLVGEDGSYQLILKSDTGFSTLNVAPVKRIKEDNKYIYRDAPFNYTKHVKTINRRSVKFDRANRRLFFRYENKKNRNIENRKKMVQSLMTNEEAKMTWEEFEEYAKSQIEIANSLAASSIEKQQGLFRLLSIEGFGIFNCDQTIRIAQPREVVAQLQENEQALYGNAVYVINHEINGVITYYHQRVSPELFNFTVSKDFPSSIVLITHEGIIAFANSEKLDAELQVPTPEKIIHLEIVTGENQLAQLKERILN